MLRRPVVLPLAIILALLLPTHARGAPITVGFPIILSGGALFAEPALI